MVKHWLTKIPTDEDSVSMLKSQGFLETLSHYILPHPFSSWLSMNLNNGGKNKFTVVILSSTIIAISECSLFLL